MLADQIKRLQSARAKVFRLERAVAAQLHAELRKLPARYGFSNVKAFVKAFEEASRLCEKSKMKSNPFARRRSRAIITNATRAAVKSMAKTGKTEAEIARSVGISLTSVHSIKKSAGLVVARKRMRR